jgi:hypothetical protein
MVSEADSPDSEAMIVVELDPVGTIISVAREVPFAIDCTT